MKVLVLLFACVALASALKKPFELRHGLPPPPPAERDARAPVWRQFMARQDNFDQFNTKTWPMRVIENIQFHTAGNPIFIMLGAEWTIDPGYLQSGLMYNMARAHGAAMFYTEHRYYGKSFPVSDLSSFNLRFLTTEQALADVAFFIRVLKSSPLYRNSKVVVVGGSYGGSMATWMRSKYPDLVHAAWSSSAPLLAKVEFSEYNEVVSKSLSQCSDIIKNGVDEVKRLLQTSEGIQKVSNDFNICQTLNVNNFGDTTYFFLTIFGTFARAVQYSSTESLANLCEHLDDPNHEDDYDKLVSYYRSSSSGCVGNYQDMVAWYRQTGLNNGDSRQWTYQTCTEYGYFQTTSSPNQPFAGIPLNMYHMWCRDFFGPNFTPAVTYAGVDAKNDRFGGMYPDVTRVISTHGTYDPWQVLGLSEDLNEEAPVIVIPNASHCADLFGINNLNDPAMIAAKDRIQKLIAEWLAL